MEEKKLCPVNGQAVCEYAGKRFGWLTMGHNGCVVLSVYNALLRMGRPVPLEQIHGIFHRPWKGRLLGVRLRELRSALELLDVPYRELLSASQMEEEMKPGDIAVMIRWNRTVPYCDFTLGQRLPSVRDFADPFGGGHGMAVERMEGGIWRVYNRYSNRGYHYDYKQLSDFMVSDVSFMGGFLLLPKTFAEESEKNIDKARRIL